MGIFIPRETEYWQRKPIGLQELNHNNHLAQVMSAYIPLDLSLNSFGYSVLGDAEIVSSGDDDTYLQWAEDGLRNSVYDGDYNDGMGLKVALSEKINYADRMLGFSLRSVPGDYTQYNFGIGDRLNADASIAVYNGLLITNDTDIQIISAANDAIFTGAFLRDGENHTYISRVVTDGATRTVELYRDGGLLGSEVIALQTHQYDAALTLGTGSNHHNRGLNGVVQSVFLVNAGYPAEYAQELSAAPYQILKPRKTYFLLNTAGASGPVLTLQGFPA